MELDKIEQGLAKFEEMQKERGVSYKEDPRRVALLRTRIQNTATLAGDEGEVKRLERMISDGANATVCVTRDVFPGVSIAIRDQVLTPVLCLRQRTQTVSSTVQGADWF